MRIAIKNGNTTYWLAGQPGVSEREFSSVADLVIQPVIQIEEQPRFRAATVNVRARGNMATTITWTTTRQFATAEAAEEFCTDYEMVMPRTGTLILASQLTGGGSRHRYLPSCVIEPPVRRATGVSVTLNYTARGGAITSSNPDP